MWKKIWFSDEVHFGWRSVGGREMISRQRGHRYSPGSIRELPKEEDTEEPRVHCWSSVGWNHKSDLIRFFTPNSVGKMSQQVYIEQILKPVVQPWIKEGRDFILLDDNDSGH